MQLVVNQGLHQGTFIPVTGKIFAIGRDESCQLRPRCEEVSRRHAELKLIANRVFIRDLGSRNGTRVNGQPLSSVVCLQHGDRIEIGPLSFTVLMENSGQAKRTERPVDDDIAAWLIGAEEDEPEFEGFELNNSETAESSVVPGRPQGSRNASRSNTAQDPAGEAYDLLKSMSVAGPETT